MDEQQKRLAEELLFSGKSSPSFAKKLYFGRFDSELAFPFPAELSSKIEIDLLNQLQHFVDAEIDPAWIDKHEMIPDSVISGLGNLGVLGMTIPKKYSGREMSQQAYCKAAEIIARRCASTALFVNAHQSIGLKALLLFGTEAQRSRWLGPLARGEQIAAFSLTEPNAGSDASGIETRAIYDSAKRVYRINGRKQWTTNGSMAQVLTVMAKTEVDTPQGKQDKITAFLVTPDLPGFIVTAPALEKLGMRGSRTANLQFVDMEVPEDRILGPIGGGLKVCLTVLDYGRTTFGATCTGAAKVLLQMAVDHARSRYQFNRPLAAFGLVKKKIARMAALVYAMDAATYLTAGFIDASREDIMLESAILKVFCSEALWSILYDTMQIYGGRSFFTDCPLERMMRDARLNMIGEGSNEVMRVFIGAVGMRDVGMEYKRFLDSMKHPWSDWRVLKKLPSRLYSQLFRPEIALQNPELGQEARQLSHAIRRFGYAVARLLACYKEDIVEQQLELERIAESAIAIYTCAAVLGKLDRALTQAASAIPAKKMNEPQNEMKEGSPGKGSPERGNTSLGEKNLGGIAEAAPADLVKESDTAKLYFQLAMNNLDVNLSSIFSPQDVAIKTLANKMTGID